MDATPASEPAPPAAVDRLARVRLTPGLQRRVDVVLRGACAGTQARLAVMDDVVLAEQSETCVEGPGLEPVPEGREARAAPLPGTFLAEPCAPEDSDDQVVCVPGGAFVMGGSESDGTAVAGSALPRAIVGLHRFWIDRYEATVGRYREALEEGLDSEGLPPRENDGDLSASAPYTWTTRPGERERYALNSISRQRARDTCAHYGGDLPTEAQWEYAAVAAGRERLATYPWGGEAPTCDRAVVNRRSAAEVCESDEPGPVAVDDPAMSGDVNALGVVGLGGNLTEWVRDAFASYEADCWRAGGPIDPWCDDDVLIGTRRGGSWTYPGGFSRAIRRDPNTPVTGASATGFRCVYAAPPSSRWSGP